MEYGNDPLLGLRVLPLSGQNDRVQEGPKDRLSDRTVDQGLPQRNSKHRFVVIAEFLTCIEQSIGKPPTWRNGRLRACATPLLELAGSPSRH